MSPGDWTGSGLQVIGGLVTIWGLDKSIRDLFPKSRGFLPFAVIRKIWSSIKRRLLRRRTIVATGAAAGLGQLTATAEGYSQKSPPTTNDIEQLQEYVIVEVANLHTRIDFVRRKQKEEMREFHTAVDGRFQEVRELMAQFRHEVPVLIGGKGGRGLEMAAWGVLIAIIGTVISAFA